MGVTLTAISLVESDLLSRIHEQTPNDSVYQRLVTLVREGTVKRYWLDDDLLYAKENCAYVPSGELRQMLLKEIHDLAWAGHPGIERIGALLARRFFRPMMEDDVEAYVRICLVCQQDKVEWKKAPSLLQSLPILDRLWLWTLSQGCLR